MDVRDAGIRKCLQSPPSAAKQELDGAEVFLVEVYALVKFRSHMLIKIGLRVLGLLGDLAETLAVESQDVPLDARKTCRPGHHLYGLYLKML